MHEHSFRFGPELRRRRIAAGLSLQDLAGRVHYSKAQLSKVERGAKSPSRELARLCDVQLSAGGELAALAVQPPIPRRTTDERSGESAGDTEEWLMRLAPDGRGWFRPLNRREAMAVGATSVAGLGWAVGGGSSSDLAFAEAATTLFEHYRRLGQSVTPGLLLPTLIAQTHTLRELARHSRFRAELLRLGSRYAEYVGWLVQETGDDQAALWWTRQAVDLAAAGGDHDLAAYGLVRRALITLYRGDARQTIDLARRAQMAALPPRIRGLAAQREAQGHALAGDLDACMRSLNRANTWLTDDRNPGVPVLGTTNLPDPVGMITGWCLYDLGRPAQAAEALDLQLSYVPAHATRTRVRYGARRALAYAVAGEVEHACALTAGLLPDIARVDSATVAADLRALSRTLNRHPRDSAVRAVAPDLAAALCPRVEPT